MKSKFLLMSALASMFLIGCSSDEPAPNGGNEGDAESRFITVNLVSSDATGGRALEGYEDGDPEENKVNSVRFYFFTANGDLAQVKKKSDGTFINYYDWKPGDENQSNDTNTGDDIEKKLAATIVINTQDGDKIPQQIVAILNPAEGVLGSESKNLTDLRNVVNDYADTKLTEDGKFVMANSVYPEKKGGPTIDAVMIKAENICKKKEDALKAPVTINVERCCAKVRIGFANNTVTTGKIALTDKDGKDIVVDGNQVYLTITGWSLTAETDNGRLIKKIDPVTWQSDWWYESGRKRCFWAKNSTSAVNKYFDFNAINNTDFKSELYTNENAAKVKGDGLAANNTKVILQGSLQKENGDPITLVRHLGVLYVDTPDDDPANNLPILAKSILAQLAAGGNYYYYDGPEVDGKKTRVQIGPDDIKIVPAKNVPSENSKNNCYVYAQLSDTGKAKKWYTSTDENAQPLADAVNVINKKLKDPAVIDWALVWNEGMTYYYYEIVHNGPTDLETSTKGVVRNHIYQTTVNKIAGLGTPVYDPDEVIYPEKPDPNDHFIAAQINILSWRVVTNSYDLEW